MNDNETPKIEFVGHVIMETEAPEFEGRKQTEMQNLERCVVRGAVGTQGLVRFDLELPFPSLQYWHFGMRGKDGVSLEKLRLLAEEITELCDQFVAHYDYQPTDEVGYYLIDKWGLAILEKDKGSASEPVETGPKIPVAPGKWLRTGWMYSGITSDELADALGVPPLRVENILEGRRPIDAEMALRLGRYFRNEPSYWLDLQAQYDLAWEQQAKGNEIERTVKPKTQGT